MNSRDTIYSQINKALDVSKKEQRKEIAEKRIKFPPKNLIPARGHGSIEWKVNCFRKWAEMVSSTTEIVTSLNELPVAIANYLNTNNLPTNVRSCSDPFLKKINWKSKPELNVCSGAVKETDQVGLTVAFGGVAETGTVIMHSGEDCPTALNFLPETHIVILPISRLAGDYETVWNLFRKEIENFPEATIPRAINWVTGPSRTADIGQQLQLGIHGPRRLHIILVEETGPF